MNFLCVKPESTFSLCGAGIHFFIWSHNELFLSEAVINFFVWSRNEPFFVWSQNELFVCGARMTFLCVEPE